MVDSSSRAPGRHWSLLIPLALVLFVGAVFWEAQAGGLLLWDDDINILLNPHLRGMSWENLQWMFSDVLYIRRYAPLAWLNWAVDFELFGLTARSCHLGNVLMHAANTVLVYCLIRKVMRLVPALAAQAGRWPELAAAGLGALVWAIHPLRVEVVAWASGRIYCQAAFFLLLSALAYLEMMTTAPGTRRRQVYWWASVAALTLSLATYPLGVTFVGVLVVLDLWWLTARSGASGTWRGTQLRPLGREKIPFVVVTAAVLGLTLWARANASGFFEPPPTLEQFGLLPRTMQAFYVWAYYLWKPLWPVDLAPVYTSLISFRAGDWPFVASMVGVCLITAVLLWRRRQWPGLLALWLINLILLAPMFGVTEHPHYTNDRYSYLVAVLWSVGLAVLWLKVCALPSWRYAAGALAAILVAAGSLASVQQVRVWKDSETLFRHTLARIGSHPYRADLAMRLGNLLGGQGRHAEAVEFFTAALRISPSFDHAHVGLGKILETQGRTAEAIAEYAAALRTNPHHWEANEGLGRTLARSGRAGEAVGFLAKAVQHAPGRSDLHRELAVAFVNSGRVAEAIVEAETAVRLDPASAEAQAIAGAAFASANRLADAVPRYERALQLQPTLLDTRTNLAEALRSLGKSPEATRQYELVLQQNPNSATAHNGLGVICALSGRFAEAVSHFAAAVRLNPGSMETQMNLGLALRDTGRLQEARDQFERLLQLKPDLAAAKDALSRLPPR